MRTCCVCKSKINLHRLPNNEIYRQLWLNALKLKNSLKAIDVCSQHFEKTDFLTEGYQTGLRNTRRILRRDAVPRPLTYKYETEQTAESLTSKIVEEVYIKEEPLDEIYKNRELYKNILQSIKKEKCITDINKQIDKECDNSDTINNDIQNSENTNEQSFETIYIKEETSQDCEFSENILQSVKKEKCISDSELHENVLQSEKKEECITDDDNQIGKACDNPISISNNIRKSKDASSKSFCCAVCNKLFLKKSYLRQHEKIHNGINAYKCPTCDKLCTHSSHLKDHMKIHTRIRDYKCETCNKSFLLNSHLKKHMKIHSGIKEYECEICNKQFTHSGSLSKHMKIHAGIRAYECPVCNKSFSQISHLKNHMNIHTGTKAYKCPTCNKSFTDNSNLNRHMALHSGIKAYKCEICNKQFTYRSSLCKHNKINHKGIK